MIGANAHAIEMAEDRELFRQAMARIGLESPKGRLVSSYDEAIATLELTGLPAVIRPSFTLGGTGGGIAYNRAEFEHIVQGGLRASPVGSVLIEESVLGWKEFEMEVVRDRADNCIIVCSIENVDPMGVHTGDSVTVAPALTLTDKEYQIMRNASIAVLREIGVDTGGSNVQFAVNPLDGRLVIIEMNPRVSRSSALASKATGFPIAKIAAKLAVGYTLDELANDITRVTPASFEPTIDYVVVKMPRFTFEKFPGAEALLTTSMKSVGEAMAIGRSFAEAVQKALRSMETGLTGFDDVDIADAGAARVELAQPDARPPAHHRPGLPPRPHGGGGRSILPLRSLVPARGAEDRRRRGGGEGQGPAHERAMAFLRLKQMGFSDARLATLAGLTEERGRRRSAGRSACAPSTSASTPAPASSPRPRPTCIPATCRTPSCPAPARPSPATGARSIILGGGPNRIGQGIEFDYCCVHAAYALREAGIETIMVNCNPETVSTDYDTSDRLYFEPLTAEDVIEIARVEQRRGKLLGVIVQLGGQTPLKLAAALEQARIPILGTSPDAIDLAEDRERFQQLLGRLGLKQPANGTARSVEEAAARRGGHRLSRGDPALLCAGRARHGDRP